MRYILHSVWGLGGKEWLPRSDAVHGVACHSTVQQRADIYMPRYSDRGHQDTGSRD
jgi:hypothetical protein